MKLVNLLRGDSNCIDLVKAICKALLEVGVEHLTIENVSEMYDSFSHKFVYKRENGWFHQPIC